MTCQRFVDRLAQKLGLVCWVKIALRVILSERSTYSLWYHDRLSTPPEVASAQGRGERPAIPLDRERAGTCMATRP